MGVPSPQQIQECIDQGLASGASEERILAEVAELERLDDAELAAFGIVPPAPEPQPEPALKPSRSTRTGAARASLLDAPEAPGFEPVPVRSRHDGWTAERQRRFIEALTATGCVSEACAEVGITARSAYRLREHPGAAGFRAAWDHALSLSMARLSAIAFERAVHGTVEQLFHKGELVGERRRPDNRLLMWLLSHHDPVTYGYLSRPQRVAPDASFYPARAARQHLPGLVETLSDVPFEACPVELVGIGHDDYDDSLDSPA